MITALSPSCLQADAKPRFTRDGGRLT